MSEDSELFLLEKTRREHKIKTWEISVKDIHGRTYKNRVTGWEIYEGLNWFKTNLDLSIKDTSVIRSSEVIELTVKEVDPYVDESFKERNCNNSDCNKPYKGPAVYCSFDCALADA
jgi:hypothetical protein